MNAPLSLALTLPFELPQWLAPGWLLWLAWFVGFGVFVLGLALLCGDDGDPQTDPDFLLFAVMSWVVVHPLAWWLADATWAAVMFHGVILALAALLVGLISLAIGRIGIILLFAAIWLTWPRPREYASRLAQAAAPLWHKVQDFVGIERSPDITPATLDTARAELDRCLAWWKSHPGNTFLDRSQFTTQFGDMHMGSGFTLKSYRIGPGRASGGGSFDFRVSMELTRITLSTGVQTLFPEKTYMVAKLPKTGQWWIEDNAMLDPARAKETINDLLPKSKPPGL